MLPSSEAEGLRKPCSREFPQELMGYWAPDRDQVVEAEKRIDALVAKELDDFGPEAYRTSYVRQYAGFHRNGQRVIYVNGVGHGFDSWRTRTINICDGSTITFGAVYDPAARRFDWFSFNGPDYGRKEPGPR